MKQCRLHDEIQTLCFQQDVARAHTAGNPAWALSEKLPARVTSLRGNIERPARSLYLIACEFFLWGYLKCRPYEKRPGTKDELKENITDEVAANFPIMRQRVMQSFQKRLRKRG
jgi:hypothetical protein